MRNLLFILLMFLCIGCGQIKVTKLNTPQRLSSISKNITNNCTNIKEANNNTNKNISMSVNNIEQNVKELKVVEKEVKNIEKGLIKVVKERDKALKDRDSQINKILSWLIIITIMGAGIFAVLFFLHGNKMGLTGSAICLVIMSISLFIQLYYIYIVIIGGLILVSLIVLIIYNVIAKNKAFKEVVQSFEVVKNGSDYKEKVNNIQSRKTIELVDKERQSKLSQSD